MSMRGAPRSDSDQGGIDQKTSSGLKGFVRHPSRKIADQLEKKVMKDHRAGICSISGG